MNLLNGILWDELDMDAVLENSYRDYHAKGLDYLCLHRTDDLTIKVYFFENANPDLPEVVNPHNHRYDFQTECLTGMVRNKWYVDSPKNLRPGKMFSSFEWDTPLNGGDGFRYSHRAMLWENGHYTAGPGRGYAMSAEEIHTIQVLKPQTCIVLAQYEDRVPVGAPTRTWVSGHGAPDINDLYNKFTADQAMKRINLVRELTITDKSRSNGVGVTRLFKLEPHPDW
ncbi:hypothetical protein MINTMi27_14760 [Mycobacterium intracellulare]|uniref:hypothetical protein n=1 Tax=Mycobacterium intracellulare TaxID=1767 RepID=UPI001926EA1B|nr:hypothetical protein [Mycobacterium intracellulare]BCP41383.1 hypothetical protein MINTMi27_14760 [Mycobacterium intracellulare]